MILARYRPHFYLLVELLFSNGRNIFIFGYNVLTVHSPFDLNILAQAIVLAQTQTSTQGKYRIFANRNIYE